LGVSPHHTDAAVKRATPTAKIFRWPYLSPKEPPVRRNAARKSA
jgi:hypothetical protein